MDHPPVIALFNQQLYHKLHLQSVLAALFGISSPKLFPVVAWCSSFVGTVFENQLHYNAMEFARSILRCALLESVVKHAHLANS